jgi:hypothetical protein
MKYFIFIRTASGQEHNKYAISKPKWTDYAQLILELVGIIVALLT